MPRRLSAPERRLIGSALDVFQYGSRRGLTAAADYFGVSRVSVSNWVNGHALPRRALRLRIFRYMHDAHPDLARRLRDSATADTRAEMEDARCIDFERVDARDQARPKWLRAGAGESVA